MSVQQEAEPDHETLVDVFASFDREGMVTTVLEFQA